MTVETLADQLAVDPGDVRVILRQHDVYVEDDLSQRNVDDVRLVLDPGGERSRHLDRGDPYGLGSRRLPTDPG